jgi:N-glycosylase/DNA lyase
MEEKKSTYTAAAKAFYERNRVAILAKEKEGKRWVEYYKNNKEKISERRKEIRKLKPKVAKPIDEEKIKRYEEIMKELPELKKEVALKRRREKKAAVFSPPEIKIDTPELQQTPGQD